MTAPGDLGMARAFSGDATKLTATGFVVGTPHYLSPEQAMGQSDVDARADLYCLGIVLYLMLTGELPFDSDSVPELLDMHIATQPGDIAELCPSLSRPMAELVMQLLRKQRDKRPSCAAEVVRMLDACDGSNRSRSARRAAAVCTESPTATLPEAIPSPDPIPASPHPEGDTALVHNASNRRLRLTRSDGPIRELFVYGQRELLLGRNRMDSGGVDCCMRLLPSREHKHANLRISGVHCRLALDPDGGIVSDCHSTAGTLLDKVGIAPGVPRCLQTGSRITLADSLTLRIDLHGDPAGAMSIVREGNRTDIAYLLINGEVPFGATGIGTGPGALRLASDRLEWRARSDDAWTPASDHPIIAGWSTGALEPAHQV